MSVCGVVKEKSPQALPSDDEATRGGNGSVSVAAASPRAIVQVVQEGGYYVLGVLGYLTPCPTVGVA